jgi:hypothetical protein
VSWVFRERPWELEDELIATLDLPLNLQVNSHNKFHHVLTAARARCVAQAKALPVVPNPGMGGGRRAAMPSPLTANPPAMTSLTESAPVTTTWVGVSGSWRHALPGLQDAVHREVAATLAAGKGIVTGGARGVDYWATQTALSVDPQRLKAILPTSRATYCALYRRRAAEGVTSPASRGSDQSAGDCCASRQPGGARRTGRRSWMSQPTASGTRMWWTSPVSCLHFRSTPVAALKTRWIRRG